MPSFHSVQESVNKLKSQGSKFSQFHLIGELIDAYSIKCSTYHGFITLDSLV